MPCNIDDKNKALHNKLQSYWDDFLFNNESPSASSVNTASVCCVCVRQNKKHIYPQQEQNFYI